MIPDKDLEASCCCRAALTHESSWAKRGHHRKSGEQFRAELGESMVAARVRCGLFVHMHDTAVLKAVAVPGS